MSKKRIYSFSVRDKIDARVREVLNDCKRKDTHFICHKTDDTCCKGFYDTRTSQLMRIARRLNMVQFVELP